VPSGDGARRDSTGGHLTFVIQEHHARRLHWDLRLERDGVLVSWAVPKGLPMDPHRNHLAVHVEDHPFDYGSFEGTIPAGEYGAGVVTIWDRGTYEASLWTDREVKFDLHGARVQARFVLFQTDGDNWMIHREDPPPPGWTPLPELVRPMLATAGDLPAGDGDDWSYEFKWDGIRTVAYVEGGSVRLMTRGDHEATASFPELRGLGELLGSRSAVLDGEVIALGDDGRPSFEALQPRLQVTVAERARRLSARTPVTYMLFDLLYLDGQPTLDRTYDERRRLLEGLKLDGQHWLVPPSHPGPGGQVLAAARATGLEGVVAKRRDSPYVPGRRSRDWIKAKLVRTQEVVIGGWTEGAGTRNGRLGALLVGIPEGTGLRYAGKVGTGFDEQTLRTLQSLLNERRQPDPPFTAGLTAADRAGASWAEPNLVGEVRFSEWTKAGKLRQPSWRGLRTDKDPGEVVRES
jgi:bifunctional non-homologous end joining protein LigD